MRVRRSLRIAGVSAFVLVAAEGWLLLRPGHDGATASNTGSLTSDQYDTAVRLARSEIEKDHATVSIAVATVVPGQLRHPNLSNACTAGHLLVLNLVGDFSTINVVPAEGAPDGPDMWVTLKADPTTGELCLEGVSMGQFAAPPQSADLTPAL